MRKGTCTRADYRTFPDDEIVSVSAGLLLSSSLPQRVLVDALAEAHFILVHLIGVPFLGVFRFRQHNGSRADSIVEEPEKNGHDTFISNLNNDERKRLIENKSKERVCSKSNFRGLREKNTFLPLARDN